MFALSRAKTAPPALSLELELHLFLHRFIQLLMCKDKVTYLDPTTLHWYKCYCISTPRLTVPRCRHRQRSAPASSLSCVVFAFGYFGSHLLRGEEWWHSPACSPASCKSLTRIFFAAMDSFCPYSQCSHLNRLITLPPRVDAQRV